MLLPCRPGWPSKPHAPRLCQDSRAQLFTGNQAHSPPGSATSRGFSEAPGPPPSKLQARQAVSTLSRPLTRRQEHPGPRPGLLTLFLEMKAHHCCSTGAPHAHPTNAAGGLAAAESHQHLAPEGVISATEGTPGPSVAPRVPSPHQGSSWPCVSDT